MLDFRIDTFLTVCQTMNFTEAARLLHITQPAVSQHIHALEKQYGARFFASQGKRIYLTEAGQIFWQTANAMQHDVRHLQEEISRISGQLCLNFGVTLTIGEYIMPQPLLRLMKERPDIRIRMIVENTDVLMKLLNEGNIDFAIIEGYYSQQSYSGITYRSERFIPVCAADYRFTKPVTELRDLLSECLFLREEGSGTRKVLEHSLMEHNLLLKDFPRLMELGNLGLIKSMVSEGMGITFIYESVVKKELEDGVLREIPLEDFPVYHDFTFLWQKGSVFDDYYREVFALLQIKSECSPTPE